MFGKNGCSLNTKIFMKKILSIILCSMPVILAYFFYPEFMGDDTFIHIGFIKGILAGDGFSYTGRVTYGSTSPLWVFLGSITTFITSNPELSLRALSALFTFLSVYIFIKIVDTLNLKPSLRFISIISLCVNPFFLRWSLSGMEATAAVFFFLLLIYLFGQKHNISHPIQFGLLLGLATLIRPEFYGFIIIYFFYALLIKKQNRKGLLKSLATSLVIVISWLGFAFWHFGTIVPNTYKAKAGSGMFSITFDGFIRNSKLFLGCNIPEFILLGLVILIVFYISMKKDGHFTEEIVKTFEKSLLNGIFLGLLFLSAFYFYYTLKDVTIISRYSLMFIPLIIIITAIAINLLLDFKNHFNVSLIVLYSFLVLLIHTHITFTIVKPASDVFVNGFQKTYREIAEIIKNQPDNESKFIALNDVGIVGCYSGAGVYDLAGLVDEDRFNYKSIKEYVEAKKPDYLILREEISYEEVLNSDVESEILFSKEIPGFGINDSEFRTVTLYKLTW